VRNSLKPLFWGSRSLKVFDVSSPEKHIMSACYDKQQVCISATVLMLEALIAVKIEIYQQGKREGTSLMP